MQLPKWRVGNKKKLTGVPSHISSLCDGGWNYIHCTTGPGVAWTPHHIGMHLVTQNWSRIISRLRYVLEVNKRERCTTLRIQEVTDIMSCWLGIQCTSTCRVLVLFKSIGTADPLLVPRERAAVPILLKLTSRVLYMPTVSSIDRIGGLFLIRELQGPEGRLPRQWTGVLKLNPSKINEYAGVPEG